LHVPFFFPRRLRRKRRNRKLRNRQMLCRYISCGYNLSLAILWPVKLLYIG